MYYEKLKIDEEEDEEAIYNVETRLQEYKFGIESVLFFRNASIE
jgi:hypothetical protein